MKIKKHFVNWFKTLSNRHSPTGEFNIFVFTMPRSGSTWLMEILTAEDKFKYCNEPFYLRSESVRKYSKLNKPEDVHDPDKLPLIHAYFDGFCKGKIGFMNPNPFSSEYRYRTSRIIFKVIHGGEEYIDWFKEKFNGRIVFMTRHPIAVSVSREQLPRTEAMISSAYSRFFTDEQITFAKEILKTGSFFERAVLDWCLQNYVPLKQRKSDWIFITYEQLVQEPEKVLAHLTEKLDLKRTQNMLENLTKPSGVLRLSDSETKKLLQDQSSNREAIISKWKKKVTPEMEDACWKIVKAFDIDIYGPDSFMPKSDYLIP